MNIYLYLMSSLALASDFKGVRKIFVDPLAGFQPDFVRVIRARYNTTEILNIVNLAYNRVTLRFR